MGCVSESRKEAHPSAWIPTTIPFAPYPHTSQTRPCLGTPNEPLKLGGNSHPIPFQDFRCI